jgi:cobalt-zinc-cadmium efflux system outer membrane protein
MRKSNYFARILIISLPLALAGCAVHPPGERQERDAAVSAGRRFQKPFESREIPDLAEQPTLDQLVEYALLTNAELEQRYWEWRSAIEQIPQDGSETSTLNVAAGTTITRGRTSWGSSTVAVANDPMTDIKWPGKLDAAAREALENARAAGRRYLRAKYEIRAKVLEAYYDYALNSELIRLEQQDLLFLQITATVSDAQSRAGRAGRLDVLKAANEADLSGNDLANMQSQLPSQRAALNALLNRPADAPLPVPTALPTPRKLAWSDEQVMELADKQNPELIALADEIRGRGDAIRLARLQYIPDFNLSAGTDLLGITQSILGQATIPAFRYEALNAAIAQAEANLRASEAMRRQASDDLGAQVVFDVTTIRDADRQLDLLQHTILPRSREIVTLGKSAYETGQSSLVDLLEDQRSLIAIQRLVANLRISREKHLADLESVVAKAVAIVED